jgi:membrane fusion protein (multidrug efflux system)
MVRAVAKEELDRAQTAAEEAAAEVVLARAVLVVAKLNVDLTTIRAPFDGRVGRVSATPGGAAKADETPLVAVESVAMVAAIDVDEKTYLEVFVPMRDAKEKAGVEIATVGGKKFKGRISHLSGRIDPNTGTARVLISVAGEGLLSGMFVRVTVATGKPFSVQIPPRSLGDKDAVFLLAVVDAGGTIRVRPIVTGRWPGPGEPLAIKDGLEPGDRVTIAGDEDIGAGTRVIVVSP